MKKFVMPALAFVLFNALTVTARAEAPITREITIAVLDVFIPENVEHMKEAKIVLSGMFPNSCYKWSKAEVSSPSDTLHVIEAKAFVTTNTMCLMVMVPFSKEVNLGVLTYGEHTLRFVSGDGTAFERTLVVR